MNERLTETVTFLVPEGTRKNLADCDLIVTPVLRDYRGYLTAAQETLAKHGNGVPVDPVLLAESARFVAAILTASMPFGTPEMGKMQ